MTSEQSANIPPCERDIFDHGESVFVTHTIAPKDIEAWVKKIAALSGQRVDWHYFAGRANILALGDIAAVKRAVEALMPEHDALKKAAIAAIRASVARANHENAKKEAK